MNVKNIVILTGAGISQESGLQTFRASDGLWENERVEDVATAEAFERDPHKVQRFYNMRRKALASVTPNAAHFALAKLERKHAGQVTVITQNVDDLHQRAGSKRLIAMHGQLLKWRCTNCHSIGQFSDDQETWELRVDSECGRCHFQGSVRPHIVWFGEMPLFMEDIHQCLETADLFVSIGTSGNVYPAAGFVQMCRTIGVSTLELNLEASAGSSLFDESRFGKATEIVPKWVDELIG